MGGEVSPMDRRWIAEALGRPICIVDLTSRDAAQSPKYRSVMQAHFSTLTDSSLIFVSEQRSQGDVVSALKSAGAIYIPGGDAEALLDNLGEQELFSPLRSVPVPVVGNSAGAVAVCADAVLTTDDDVQNAMVRPGLGLVNFSVAPHYDSTHDEELLALSVGRDIYGLPEESAIVADGRSTEFVGSVWRFADGRKEKVN